jgi:tellurite resistance protein
MPSKLVRTLVKVLGHHGAPRAGAHAIEPRLVAELALWSATADGVLDQQDVEELAGLLRQLPGLEGFDVDEAMRLVDAMACTYTTEESIAARVTEIALAIHSAEARRASYQLALWSAARDGHFSEEEVSFLESLQECLEISDEEAEALLHQIIEVH